MKGDRVRVILEDDRLLVLSDPWTLRGFVVRTETLVEIARYDETEDGHWRFGTVINNHGNKDDSLDVHDFLARISEARA